MQESPEPPLEPGDGALADAAALVARVAKSASRPLAVLGRVALASGVAVGFLVGLAVSDRTEGAARLWSLAALVPLVPGLLTARHARRLAAIGAAPGSVHVALRRFTDTAQELGVLWRGLLHDHGEDARRPSARVIWRAWRAVKLAVAKGSEVSQRSWEVQEAVGVPTPVTLWAGLVASGVLVAASPVVAAVALTSLVL